MPTAPHLSGKSLGLRTGCGVGGGWGGRQPLPLSPSALQGIRHYLPESRKSWAAWQLTLPAREASSLSRACRVPRTRCSINAHVIGRMGDLHRPGAGVRGQEAAEPGKTRLGSSPWKPEGLSPSWPRMQVSVGEGRLVGSPAQVGGKELAHRACVGCVGGRGMSLASTVWEWI